MKNISKNFISDKYYPVIRKAVKEIINKQNYVSPIDLFICCERLDKKKYEEWRLKKIPYLEKVINGNLSVLKRFLHILKYHAKNIALKESKTIYKSWGKGNKSILRFSKSGNAYIEKLYSTHYIKTTNDK